MGIKSVHRLNEGPLDFVRGASTATGQKMAQTAPVRAVRDVVAAGQASSKIGDIKKAITAFVQTYSQYQKLRGTTQQPQAQQPQAQQPQARGVPSDAVPSAFKQTQKPRMAPGAHGYQYKFEQFIQSEYADSKLDEGVFDFMKGAAGHLKDKATKWAEAQAAKTTGMGAAVRDVVQAGVAQSRSADAAKATAKVGQLKTQAEQQLAGIIEMLKAMGPQAAKALDQAVTGMGDQAPQIRNIIARNAARRGVTL